VLGFTRYLATYWAPAAAGQRDLAGGVENARTRSFVPHTPARRRWSDGDAARLRGATVFLASDASAYMTGTNLVVDGGFTAW